MSWEIEYKKKLRTPQEALRSVQSGMRVYIQPGCAEPETARTAGGRQNSMAKARMRQG